MAKVVPDFHSYSNGEETEEVIEKLFPKCRPKQGDDKMAMDHGDDRPAAGSGHFVPEYHRRSSRSRRTPPKRSRIKPTTPTLRTSRVNEFAAATENGNGSHSNSRHSAAPVPSSPAAEPILSNRVVPLPSPVADAMSNSSSGGASPGRVIETVIADEAPFSLGASPSPVREKTTASDVSRLMGNVMPIAKYEGSPRRYGPKPPGYPQRYTSRPNKLDVPEQSIRSNALVDIISCDDLVKSILSIPPSKQHSRHRHELSTSSSAEDGELCSPMSATAANGVSRDEDNNYGDEQIMQIAGTNGDIIEAALVANDDDPQQRSLQHKQSNLCTTLSSSSPSSVKKNSLPDMASTLLLTPPSNSTLMSHVELDQCLHDPSRDEEMHEPTTTLDTTSGDIREVAERSSGSGSSPRKAVPGSARPGTETTSSTSSLSVLKCPSVSRSTSKPVTPSQSSNELILLQDRLVHQPHIFQEPTSERSTVGNNHTSYADGCIEDYADGDLGDDQVDEPRNFTLSPESTDCDSNEIESEFSMGDDSAGSRLNQMPILEDGLSSGLPSCDSEYESENDRPLSLDIMKKQISDIEVEIRSKLVNAKERQRERDRERDSRDSESDCLTTTTTIVPGGIARPVVNGQLSSGEAVQNNLSPNGDYLRQVTDQSMPAEEDGEKCAKLEAGEECDTDQETDRLLGAQRAEDRGFFDEKKTPVPKKKNASREGYRHEPAVLIEGVLFRARYLGSTQLVCEGQPTKATRMMQAEEAVSRIKAPEGATQPSTEVDLFISTEKIMVLNTDLKEIMMDHALRTISYIADIGDLLVLMARRRVMSGAEDEHKIKRTPKMICHVFESEEAQFIAQSIGQAFQVAYMEFLKANGIEDSSFVKEMDYQEVLNSQEIFGNELEMFAKKDRQKEVIVPKQKNEILGMVIVESGWGSMLPTVVIANMAHASPASRCGHLNIGDQIIAINGVSLVGLPLSTCQHYIKNTKMQTAVKLTVVPCAPVVEVKIKRPDTKYQLGFSVQNGVICSLLRGGIAERGGVRVGHRIIEINGQSVVAVPHERIVSLLATSVGEICMKTMPTSMFRLLTGQETPVFI